MARMLSTTKLLCFYLFLLYFATNFEAFANISEANANFSKKLYEILSRKEGNIIYSPISVHAILSLVYQGAGGETAASLKKALNLSDSRITAEDYQGLMQDLNSSDDVQINFANKIFLNKAYPLKEEFNTTAKKSFLSEAENVNFAESVAAANKINSWVENKTNNKIKDLVSSDNFDGSTALFLVNAIYFKGEWLEKFDHTEKKKFYLSEAETVDADMMSVREDFKYIEDEDLHAQIVSLPYTNQDFSLIVVLPRSKTDIKDVGSKFQRRNLTQLYDTLGLADVSLTLPKFKIEATINLNEPLKELGLGVMFDNAEFPNMLKSSQSVTVSKVLQKAFFDVNEKGTEAAAATGVQIQLTSGVIKPQLPSVVFNADHPFLFSLCYRHNGTATPLFVGTLKNPS